MAEQVEFHTGVEDVLDFACRLLRKAQRQSVQLVCTAPAPTLEALDKALWTSEEREFVPHVRWPGSPPGLLRRSPIWLSLPLDKHPPLAWDQRICVNVGAPVLPEWVATMPRLIEIVGTDSGAVARGRGRWSAYKAAGLKVLHQNAEAR